MAMGSSTVTLSGNDPDQPIEIGIKILWFIFALIIAYFIYDFIKSRKK